MLVIGDGARGLTLKGPTIEGWAVFFFDGVATFEC